MKYSRLLLAIAFPVTLLTLFMVTLQTKASPSATFTVNSTVDAADANPGDGVCETAVGNGVCTLRAAINESNALNGETSVSLPAGYYTITLSNTDEDLNLDGDFDVNSQLTIIGVDQASTIIQAGDFPIGDSRIFHVLNGQKLILNNVTLQYGYAFGSSPNNQGGAIYNGSGELQLNNCTLSLNRASYDTRGGAIYNNNGIVEINNTTFYRNILQDGSNNWGGAIFNFDGTLTIANSHFISNTVGGVDNGEGAAIYNNNNSTLLISESTFQYNRALGDNAGGYGGSLGNQGKITVTNSTFNENHAWGGEFVGGRGGVIFNNSPGQINIINSTLSTNTAENSFMDTSGKGGSIHNNGGVITLTNTTLSNNNAEIGSSIFVSSDSTVILRNSIVANSLGGDECEIESGMIINDGANLVTDGSCGFPMTDEPLLGPLQINGGSTLTHAPSEGSPAIDSANPAYCPEIDQRFYPRPFDGDDDETAVCDIGSVEYGSFILKFVFLPFITNP